MTEEEIRQIVREEIELALKKFTKDFADALGIRDANLRRVVDDEARKLLDEHNKGLKS